MRRSGRGAFILLACLCARALPAPAVSVPPIVYLLGVVHERFGRPAAELTFYRPEAELDPSSRFLQETLADLCLNLGRLDEALASARKAAALAGPDPAAQVLVGRVDLARGDRAGAAQAFEQALTIDPSYGEALIYAAYLRAPDEPAKAAAFLERYLKEEPDSVEALTRLAALYESLKDLNKAEDFWRQAADRDPTRASASTPRWPRVGRRARGQGRGPLRI